MARVRKSAPIDARPPPQGFDEGHIFGSRLHRKNLSETLGAFEIGGWIPPLNVKGS
jgi:hypothetical protein